MEGHNCNERRDTHTDTDWWEGRMNYAIIYMPSFMKVGSGSQKLIGRIHRHRQDGDRVNLL
jgi:hypothetical protein